MLFVSNGAGRDLPKTVDGVDSVDVDAYELKSDVVNARLAKISSHILFLLFVYLHYTWNLLSVMRQNVRKYKA